MAKKDKKAPKKKDGRDPSDVVDAVRGAVERTFQATAGQTEGARDRGRNLLDEVASAAQRIRESFDDLRVLEDVRGLRNEIKALSERVAALERAAATPASPAAAAVKPAAPKAPAKASAAGTAAAKTGPPAKPRTSTTTRRRTPSSSGGSTGS